MTVMNNSDCSWKDRKQHSAGKITEERDSDRVYSEADQESVGSSTEELMESPSSVVKVKKWPAKNVDVRVHIQILRIREEDSHLGYDIVVNFSSKDNKIDSHDHQFASNVGVVLFPRQILPASPLGAGGRTEMEVAH